MARTIFWENRELSRQPWEITIYAGNGPSNSISLSIMLCWITGWADLSAGIIRTPTTCCGISIFRLHCNPSAGCIKMSDGYRIRDSSGSSMQKFSGRRRWNGTLLLIWPLTAIRWNLWYPKGHRIGPVKVWYREAVPKYWPKDIRWELFWGTRPTVYSSPGHRSRNIIKRHRSWVTGLPLIIIAARPNRDRLFTGMWMETGISAWKTGWSLLIRNRNFRGDFLPMCPGKIYPCIWCSIIR